MNFTQARIELLAEHRGLRVVLAELGHAAAGVGRDASLDELNRLAKRLCFRVAEHMLHEEAIVRPALAEGDSFAVLRLERYDNEHAAQREMLSGLLDVLRGE